MDKNHEKVRGINSKNYLKKFEGARECHLSRVRKYLEKVGKRYFPVLVATLNEIVLSKIDVLKKKWKIGCFKNCLFVINFSTDFQSIFDRFLENTLLSCVSLVTTEGGGN